MVPVRMMQEILDLKAKGFSVNERTYEFVIINNLTRRTEYLDMH